MSPRKEVKHLDALVYWVYAKRDFPQGYQITQEYIFEDFHLAIPLQKGQISCRELMNGEVLTKALTKDPALALDFIEGLCSANPHWKSVLCDRGI
jgi:N-acetylneuraminate synthase